MILFVLVFLAMFQTTVLQASLPQVSRNLEQREFAKNMAAERLGDVYQQLNRSYGRSDLAAVYRDPDSLSTAVPNIGSHNLYRAGQPFTFGSVYGNDIEARNSRNLSFQVLTRLGQTPWSGEFVFGEVPFAGGGTACPNRVNLGFAELQSRGVPDYHFPDGRTYGNANQGAVWAQEPQSDPGGFISGPQRASDWRLQGLYSSFSSRQWEIPYDHEYFDSLSPITLNKVIGDSEVSYRMGDVFSRDGVPRSAYSGMPSHCAFVWNDGYRRNPGDLQTTIRDGSVGNDGVLGVIRPLQDGVPYWGDRTLEAISASRNLGLDAQDTNLWIRENLVERQDTDLVWGDPNVQPPSIREQYWGDPAAQPASIRDDFQYAGIDPSYDPQNPGSLVDQDGNYRLSLLSQDGMRDLCEDVFFPGPDWDGVSPFPGHLVLRGYCQWGDPTGGANRFDWSTFRP